MNWDNVIDRLSDAGIKPIEEIYMENYGKVLTAERQEFHGRYFRCTYGVVRCEGVRIEVFLFPSETHLQDFLEVTGDDPWWVAHQNVLLHFPEADPAVVGTIMEAIWKP